LRQPGFIANRYKLGLKFQGLFDKHLGVILRPQPDNLHHLMPKSPNDIERLSAYRTSRA
jgi:hypothetical protein